MCMAQSILQRMVRVRGRGYVGILQRAREFPVKQGGTADLVNSSLTRLRFCQGFFFAHKQRRKATQKPEFRRNTNGI